MSAIGGGRADHLGREDGFPIEEQIPGAERCLVKERASRSLLDDPGGGWEEKPLLGWVHGNPRRWVVKRANAWHNRFRGLLIRWEWTGAHYLAFLHLAYALISFQQAQ